MAMQNGKSQVLVVDDEKSIRITVKDFLEDEGFVVSLADGFAQARELLSCGDFDVAVIDRILSNGQSGLDIIRYINTAAPRCKTILITAYPTIESAQCTVRNGSSDYLVKPFTRDEICHAVKKAAQSCMQARGEKQRVS